VARSCEHGDEPSNSGATELVSSLHATKALGWRGSVAPTHSRTRH
jgi:hypothetical protein